MENRMYKLSIENLFLLLLAGRFSQKGGWDHTGMKRNFNLLVYIEEGNCVFRLQNREISLSKDDIILVPQNTLYRPYTNSYCKYSYYHFFGEIQTLMSTSHDKVYFPEETNALSGKNTCIILPEKCKINGKVLTYLNVVLEELQSYDIGSSFRMNLAFLNALNSISTVHSLQAIDNLAKKLEQYIDKNFRHELTLTDIAQHFGYTKQYIIQIFKRNYSISPSKYINFKRLDLSLSYLTETSLRINEIAEKCGFSDANYYSRIFKARFAISPLEYRTKFNMK